MEMKVAETRKAEAITALRAENEALKAEYTALKAENAELSQKVEWLMEQLRLSRHKRFGASSEKSTDEGMEQLSLLFDEAEVYTVQEAAGSVAVAAHVRNRKSGSVRDILPESIPVEVVEHRLSEEERSCPQCGELMAEICGKL